MRITRFARTLAVVALATASLTGCNSTQTVQRLCTDPLASAFAALEAGKPLEAGTHSGVQANVNAQELATCTSEALGQLKGYREETIKNGEVQSQSRVNISPLKVNMVMKAELPNHLEEVILIEGFAFAKVDGQWIEVTEDAADPTIRSLLNLPKSFQTQFNPKLRAAGTDPAIIYNLVGTGKALGQPVLILEAKIANGTDSYTSRYYLNKDYVLLRSEAVSSSGTTTSQLTDVDVPQTITNPLLPAKK
ncbi:MAG: hypothetical protein PUK59_05820 [Actinomycetaceae bacterium]|nr:hypothetical protein [Actinomycetaceae bacterium]MDY5854741.1 hypothetical protein [Arcanobacterium sp.]